MGGELIGVLIYLVIWGLVLSVLWWAIGAIGLPEPFHKVATVVLVLVAVIILLNVLLGLTGASLFEFRPRRLAP